MGIQQNLINHVAFVLDGSGSMAVRHRDVISVFDGQIAWLAKRSREMDQETRVTVYVFDDRIECVIFDKDVLRLPSIKDLYWTRYSTALRDATIKSQEDLAKTFTEYGNHAFLTFVLTDGEENASNASAFALRNLLSRQGDNWTIAALVPNSLGKVLAEDAGFPKGNVEIWDVNSATGIAETGARIQAVTDTYMEGRASGIRGTKTLFAQPVSKAAVDASGMKPLSPDQFFLFPAVPTNGMAVHIPKKTILKSRPEGLKHVEIKEMVESTGRTYILGSAFYELRKSEKITGNKRIAVVDRATSQVYLGREARILIGLDDADRRIKPMPVDKDGNRAFKIFVESQSTNRLLEIGSQVLLLK